MPVATASMSTRSRRRSRPEAETYDDEFGLVTDADIDVFVAEQEVEEEVESDTRSDGFLNLQTGAGLGLIGVGGLYAMQVMGLLSLESSLLYTLVQVLPILASVLIMLTGFGVLSWSPAARRRRQARARAARLRQRQKTMGRSGKARPRSQTEEVGRGKRALEQAERIARRSARAASDTASTAYASARANKRKNYRLAKDRSRRKISGVAAGIADYFGLEPTLVRIAFVLAAIFGQGAGVLLYIILSMALPSRQPDGDDRGRRDSKRKGRDERSRRSKRRRRDDDDDDDDFEFSVEDD